MLHSLDIFSFTAFNGRFSIIAVEFLQDIWALLWQEKGDQKN